MFPKVPRYSGAHAGFALLLASAPVAAEPGAPAPRTPHAAPAVATRAAATAASSEAVALVRYWKDGGRQLWFGKDLELDRRLRERFLPLHQAAARGELDDWRNSAEGALALVLLLDQFPRNAFRGTPRMYATDELARHAATRAIEAGHDYAVERELRLFFYLPFAHSESLSDQDRCVDLVRRFDEVELRFAERHRGIIRRFGRFPHRNEILGRPLTAEEKRYLDEGGFSG